MWQNNDARRPVTRALAKPAATFGEIMTPPLRGGIH
jgi:hypothetical protein